MVSFHNGEMKMEKLGLTTYSPFYLHFLRDSVTWSVFYDPTLFYHCYRAIVVS